MQPVLFERAFTKLCALRCPIEALRKNMRRTLPTCFAALAMLCLSASAQQSLTWEQVKTKFEAANPSLKVNALMVDESKAQEVTAHLRPNPQFSLSADGTQIVPDNGVWKPFAGTDISPN